MRKYIWRQPKAILSSDDAELRVLRQMVIASDSMRSLKMISEEEHQKTLAYVDDRLTELEVKHGLREVS